MSAVGGKADMGRCIVPIITAAFDPKHWQPNFAVMHNHSLIVRDFKQMDRLAIVSDFNAIQNNSDPSQGLSPRLPAQSAAKVAGIVLPQHGDGP